MAYNNLWHLFQYQVKTDPGLPPQAPAAPPISYSPFSEPVRSSIAPALAIALIASGLFETIFIPLPSPTGTGTVVPVNCSGPPPVYRKFQYQAKTEPVLVTAVAPVTSEDQWHQLWSEPVRI